MCVYIVYIMHNAIIHVAIHCTALYSVHMCVHGPVSEVVGQSHTCVVRDSISCPVNNSQYNLVSVVNVSNFYATYFMGVLLSMCGCTICMSFLIMI